MSSKSGRGSQCSGGAPKGYYHGSGDFGQNDDDENDRVFKRPAAPDATPIVPTDDTNARTPPESDEDEDEEEEQEHEDADDEEEDDEEDEDPDHPKPNEDIMRRAKQLGIDARALRPALWCRWRSEELSVAIQAEKRERGRDEPTGVNDENDEEGEESEADEPEGSPGEYDEDEDEEVSEGEENDDGEEEANEDEEIAADEEENHEEGQKDNGRVPQNDESEDEEEEEDENEDATVDTKSISELKDNSDDDDNRGRSSPKNKRPRMDRPDNAATLSPSASKRNTRSNNQSDNNNNDNKTKHNSHSSKQHHRPEDRHRRKRSESPEAAESKVVEPEKSKEANQAANPYYENYEKTESGQLIIQGIVIPGPPLPPNVRVKLARGPFGRVILERIRPSEEITHVPERPSLRALVKNGDEDFVSFSEETCNLCFEDNIPLPVYPLCKCKKVYCHQCAFRHMDSQYQHREGQFDCAYCRQPMKSLYFGVKHDHEFNQWKIGPKANNPLYEVVRALGVIHDENRNLLPNANVLRRITLPMFASAIYRTNGKKPKDGAESAEASDESSDDSDLSAPFETRNQYFRAFVYVHDLTPWAEPRYDYLEDKHIKRLKLPSVKTLRKFIVSELQHLNQVFGDAFSLSKVRRLGSKAKRYISSVENYYNFQSQSIRLLERIIPHRMRKAAKVNCLKIDFAQKMFSESQQFILSKTSGLEEYTRKMIYTYSYDDDDQFDKKEAARVLEEVQKACEERIGQKEAWRRTKRRNGSPVTWHIIQDRIVIEFSGANPNGESYSIFDPTDATDLEISRLLLNYSRTHPHAYRRDNAAVALSDRNTRRARSSSEHSRPLRSRSEDATSFRNSDGPMLIPTIVSNRSVNPHTELMTQMPYNAVIITPTTVQLPFELASTLGPNRFYQFLEYIDQIVAAPPPTNNAQANPFTHMLRAQLTNYVNEHPGQFVIPPAIDIFGGSSNFIGSQSRNIIGNQSNSIFGNQGSSADLNQNRNIFENPSCSVNGDQIPNIMSNQNSSVNGHQVPNNMANQSSSVNGNQIPNNMANQSSSVNGHQNPIIMANQSSSVNGHQNPIIMANLSSSVNGHQNPIIMANQSSSVNGHQNPIIMANQSSSVNGHQNPIIMANQSSSVNGHQIPNVNVNQNSNIFGNQRSIISGSQILNLIGNQRSSAIGNQVPSAARNPDINTFGNVSNSDNLINQNTHLEPNQSQLRNDFPTFLNNYRNFLNSLHTGNPNATHTVTSSVARENIPSSPQSPEPYVGLNIRSPTRSPPRSPAFSFNSDSNMVPFSFGGGSSELILPLRALEDTSSSDGLSPASPDEAFNQQPNNDVIDSDATEEEEVDDEDEQVKEEVEEEEVEEGALSDGSIEIDVVN